MGRKPNQLVLEFFSRGPKLEDASNRYQYTCKACGEHFAKGRMENLANHLAKNCGALSGEDRHRALLQLRQVPGQSRIERPEGDVHGGGSERGFGGRDAKLPPALTSSATASSTTGKRLSGLEALAEASRRVEHPVLSGQDENVIDPSLKDYDSYERLFDSATRVQNELGMRTTEISVGDFCLLMDVATSIAFDSDQFLVSNVGDQSLSSTFSIADQALGISISASGTAIDLANIAASASHLHASLTETEPSVTYETANGHGPFDVYSELQALRPPSTWPSKRTTIERSPSNEEEAGLERASTQPSRLALGSNSQFMNDTFGEQQNRVQKIRGKFSEVRRKEVQEVRKRGACIRYLYGKLARQAVDQARNANTTHSFTKSSSRILATHVQESNIYLACEAVVSDIPERKSEISSALSVGYQILLLDDTLSDSATNLDAYVKAIGPCLYDQEPSQFMRVTISIASDLCVERNDNLLLQAIELWTVTALLLDSEPWWKIYQYFGPLSNIHLHILPDRENMHMLGRGTTGSHYRRIRAQLRALTEKKAFKLSRSILNDLERRLLQKSESQSFGTFLVALILLSCVERMCWLYHGWDSHEQLASWPLHYPPIYYSQQGDTFSDLICMLLRMRGVPPKTTAHAESGFLAPVSRKDAAVVQWFEEVKLSNTYLSERATAPFDAGDPRCWELRFAGKLFLA
ncbi:hypothetical protein MMC18_001476 [Xylographa bjoerkii]|nr:hypothetical protein [Xylographa bjoerkii]